MAALDGLRRGAVAWTAAITRFVFPEECAACGTPLDSPAVLCAPCRAAIPLAGIELCARCLAREQDADGCVRHPGFRVRPAWVYDERAAALVTAFKYQGRLAIAPDLAATLAHVLQGCGRPDAVTEVPLHAARRRERGYNQAALLAEAVAARLGAPWLPGALERTRPTAPQARLGPARRRANVNGAFRVMRPEALKGRNILLIDDVVTTGATLAACLEALEHAGARARAATLAWAQ